MTNTEGGTDDEEFRVAAVKDRVDTTMDVWMGLTIGCAKCHSHKFDPITQKEYYQFCAIFNQTADNDQPNESPTLSLPLAGNGSPKRRRSTSASPRSRNGCRGQGQEDAQKADRRLGASQAAGADRPRDARAAAVEAPQDARDDQGQLSRHGRRGGPWRAGLLRLASQECARPIGSRWPAGSSSRDNPLTARVAVNRVWSQLFGQGLVETEEDFGTQGKPPSHPELLDWLAVRYMDHGWDTKWLVRLLVTSATYRQSSRITAEALQKDPGNRLLSHAPRYRLEAEMVRDQALALSGLLSDKMKGPSVFPPQPSGLWRAAFNGRDRAWTTSPGEDRYRRGLYTFWRRTIPYPSMTTFDAPSREICSVRRIRTNTPLQAFVTLNDPVYVEAAQALARRIVHEGGASPEERCRYALELCLVSPPKPKQIDELVSLLMAERKHYREDAKAAHELATEPLGQAPPGVDEPELAAWTVVANVLLNLDGVLTKG